ncbi:MAG: hypothetical protein J4G04_00765 [Nitrosopumilaceae archaeon]|nr:hypothetical protein [Nitrosopumilaceae archaeon]
MAPRLEPLDVEFLALGADGPFDERILAGSALKRLGTGRMLDALGSMLERGLIYRRDGGFAVSAEARAYLWDRASPIQTRILRLLDMLPLEIPRIKSYLNEDDIEASLRSLQEEGMVQSYPTLQDGIPVPIFQITGEGSAFLGGGYDVAAEVSRIIREVSGLDADPSRRGAILERLGRLERHLASHSSGRGSAPE